MSSEKKGGLLGSALDMFGHGLASVGILQEMPDTEEVSKVGQSITSSTRTGQPAPLPNPGANAAVAVMQPTSSKVEERFKKDLEKVLGVAPDKFREYLEHKAGVRESLAEMLSGEQLELAASKAALKVSGLTAADVQQAIAAMKVEQGNIRTKFDVTVQQTKTSQVDEPTRQIEQTQSSIKQIEDQITDLQNQIASKRAGIQPTRDKIAEAETKLQQAQATFEAAETRVEQYLTAMEQQLLGQLGAKK